MSTVMAIDSLELKRAMGRVLLFVAVMAFIVFLVVGTILCAFSAIRLRLRMWRIRPRIVRLLKQVEIYKDSVSIHNLEAMLSTQFDRWGRQVGLKPETKAVFKSLGLAAIPPLLEAIYFNTEDIYSVRKPSLDALTGVGAPAVPYLIEISRKHRDSHIRERVYAEIQEIGKPALRFLLPMLKDSNPDVRLFAAHALPIEAIGKPALRILLQLLKDSNPDVRLFAAQALPHALSAVSFTFIPWEDAVRECARDADERIRSWAAGMLERIVPSHEAYKYPPRREDIAVWIQLLRDDNPEIRRIAVNAQIWRNKNFPIGAMKDQAVSVLIERLDDSDEGVRYHAGWALYYLTNPPVGFLGEKNSEKWREWWNSQKSGGTGSAGQ